MIIRALTLAGGVAGAAGLSQFPEFSQQYVQRLGGAVDALEQVATDFDASAAAEGMTRQEALGQMQGTDFIERRRADMENTFVRLDRLKEDLATLTNAGPFMRAYHAARVDTEVASATWGDYKPAMPLTLEGGAFTGAGFFAGWVMIAGLIALLKGLLAMLWRREPA